MEALELLEDIIVLQSKGTKKNRKIFVAGLHTAANKWMYRRHWFPKQNEQEYSTCCWTENLSLTWISRISLLSWNSFKAFRSLRSWSPNSEWSKRTKLSSASPESSLPRWAWVTLLPQWPLTMNKILDVAMKDEEHGTRSGSDAHGFPFWSLNTFHSNNSLMSHFSLNAWVSHCPPVTILTL